MKKVTPYKRYSNALKALDNGGRFYNIFTNARDDKVSRAELKASLRHAISEYVVHYHEERAHQGIGNERIERAGATRDGEVVCAERLGGLLKCYRRAA
jgi:hypothetical protein